MNFADTQLGKEPFVDFTEYIFLVTSGARALGVAATSRRYRPLALTTKERGVWLTLQAWLRRATVSGYKKLLNAPWNFLVLAVVRRVPTALARARAMGTGWAAAEETAAAARALAPARSWFSGYGATAELPVAASTTNLAAVPKDRFLKGEAENVIGIFTPIHIGVGLVTVRFLALVVSRTPRGRGARRPWDAVGLITITIILVPMQMTMNTPAPELHGVASTSWSSSVAAALALARRGLVTTHFATTNSVTMMNVKMARMGEISDSGESRVRKG